jgi:hypothetical protein
MARVTSTEILAAIKDLADGMSDEAWTTLGKVVVAEISAEDAEAQREMLERHSECGGGTNETPPPFPGTGGYH